MRSIKEYMERCDLSTINMDELEKLPLYEGNLRVETDGMGSGCAMDPPGYPSYFVQHIWTRNGNTPRGACMVLLGHVVQRSDDDYDNYKKLLRSLWNPLPLDHPRTRMWIKHGYSHMGHCYIVKEKGPGHKEDKWDTSDTLIFPVPSYKLRSIPKFDPEMYTQNYIDKAVAEIKAHNEEILRFAASKATPENHNAVRMIRRYYPDYAPELDLIENPPASVPHWYDRFAEKPDPCPGYSSTDSRWRHPINGTWCQMCGWKQQTVEEGVPA